ncbi:APC family permease [Lactiplantibacillus plantarum]|uniref:APC family permease n=1 Tax=Lactiplantibacillus plantarum TaxID=1590 RepID=UPI000A2071C3|nr:APC family permease [Lactiplantibacillus plantarum]ARO01518.1 porin [Lactiplantibacillus plantarum]ARO04424.1 porin [Lactiplantibacillus plantarum]MBP5840392.1 APC family permease [Lactiplantibacillus plantarum]OYL13118.1 porin [Lactiplantibacillus plantarum]
MDLKHTPSSSNTNLDEFGYQQELKRTLSVKDLVIYGLIFMVPIAPMGIYGAVISVSQGMIALTYAIGMLAMFFTALSYGQMSQAFPVAGSVYAYAKLGINKSIGFLSGWMIILDYIFVPALLYIIAANSLKSLLPTIPTWLWLVGFIAINTLINVGGIAFTAIANRIFLIGELIVLAFFIILGSYGLMRGIGNGFTLKPFYDASHFNLNFVMTATSVAVLSFLGFDGISTLAEETTGGNQAVGKGILWSLLIVGALFIIQTYLAALIVPNWHSFNDLNTAFYVVAGKVGGPFLTDLTTIATILSWGFANALAAQAAISRILFGMARDHNLPHVLARVHPRFKTPYMSTLLVAIISLLVGLTFMNDSGPLSEIVNCGALTAFLVIHIAVINHFFIKQHSHDYWHHLIVPIIGFIIIGFVMINLNVLAKEIGGIWLLIGIGYYLILRVLQRNTEMNL